MENKFSTSDNWNDYEGLLPKFTDSIILTNKLINKKNIPNPIIKNNECLICYNKVNKNTSNVNCELCSNVFHYECYKTFVEKNKNYESKCCQCSTESLKFNMKYWWNCCW